MKCNLQIRIVFHLVEWSGRRRVVCHFEVLVAREKSEGEIGEDKRAGGVDKRE
jgi:hypothetical protein